MASRVIHYIVGQKVTERIHLQDSERYRKDELYLGYMCHLVTDAIWVKNVIVPLKEANGGCRS